MAIIKDDIQPGDRWLTFTPGYGEHITDFCEAPRHETAKIPAAALQVFVRDDELVAAWATCQECNDMMHAEVKAEKAVERGEE